MFSEDLPDRRRGTHQPQYITLLTYRSMASEGFSSNTPPNPASAGLSAEQNHTSLSGPNGPERQTSQYSVPIKEGSITLADIWGLSTPPDNRSSPNQHQHSHLNNPEGPDFLQWSQNQTETGGQRLKEAMGPSHHLPEWNSVERADVPGGTRSGLSNHHRLALEEVIPRDTAVYMISLYFDYVGAPEDVLSPSLTQYRSTLWYLVFTDPLFFSECTNATTRTIPDFSLC
jgi:hypothetical protein